MHFRGDILWEFDELQNFHNTNTAWEWWIGLTLGPDKILCWWVWITERSGFPIVSFQRGSFKIWLGYLHIFEKGSYKSEKMEISLHSYICSALMWRELENSATGLKIRNWLLLPETLRYLLKEGADEADRSRANFNDITRWRSVQR